MWFVLPLIFAAGCSLFNDTDPKKEALNKHADACSDAARGASRNMQSRCTVGEPTPQEALRLVERGECLIECTDGGRDANCTTTVVTDLQGERVGALHIQCTN